jgi:DNA replication protein DnaC
MDGMATGIKENLKDLFSSHISMGLPNPNEVEFYECPECGKRVDRKEFSIPFTTDKPDKKLIKSTYVFPACPCLTKIIENDEMMSRRLQRKNYMEQIYKQNLMNDSLRAARFSNFIERPGTEIAFKDALQFAKEFERRKQGILLYGDPGNGKSHLCASVHHQLSEEGFVCLFLEVQRLLKIAEDAKRFSSKVNVSDIINAAVQCDLLTLDEIGVGKLTQDDYDVLAPIINGRQGKVTNYTMNLNIDELNDWFRSDAYGKPLDTKARMIDRVIGSCDIVKNNGTSKRQEDALNRMKT